MTGKDILLKYIEITPNSQIYQIINGCPSRYGLNENQDECDEMNCSICWKEALEEEWED